MRLMFKIYTISNLHQQSHGHCENKRLYILLFLKQSQTYSICSSLFNLLRMFVIVETTISGVARIFESCKLLDILL